MGLRFVLNRIKRWGARETFKRIPGSSEQFGPPRGFYPTAAEYTVAFEERAPSPVTYQEIYPPSQFKRRKAHTLETENVAPAFKLEEPVLTPSQGVHFIEGGRVFGDDVAIISHDDKVVLDLSMFFDAYYHTIFYKRKLPKATYIDGDVLIVANCPGNNYGHWLHQVLPRFHLAEQAGVKFAELSAILINNSTAPFTSQTLDLLGIPKEKRILVGPNQHFKARRLIVPTIPPGGNPPRWVFDYLRKSYLKCTVPSRREKRVYISRKCAPTRRFTNEEEVEEAVKKFGFEIVQLEHLPFARQAELFRECEAVVSTHGSGLTNMAFCEPATKIIEIYAPGFPEICWWNMSCVLDLDYYFLYAEGTRKPYANDIRDNHVNSKCNIPMLVETIKSAGL